MAFSMLLTFNSCEEDVNEVTLDYVTFEADSYDFPVDVGSTITMDVKLFATKASSSERIINVNVVGDETTADPNSYIIPSVVTIPAGETEGSFQVTVSDVNIGGGGETLTVAFAPTSDFQTSNSITFNISQVCDYPVMLDIMFDGYASECTYEITDSSGNVVTSDGPWADGTASYSKSLCLADGTYTFSVSDTYGDGLSWPNNGSITVMHNGQTLVDIVGDYGYGTAVQFDISN